MKSIMIKTTLREIRQSLGRYLAIFAIVALGVVMFAGLKVCKEAMVNTGNKYLAETVFYDIRLLSTIGFEQEEVERIEKLPDVRIVEGAVAKDVIEATADGGERVVAAHSITGNINKLVLKAGRLPENDRECVIDSYHQSASEIGRELVLSQNNEQDTLDFFKYDSYTVVGVVQSPYYLNYERGTTSIGNGSVSSFVYMNRDAFVSDYETEVFVKLDVDEEIYSEAYNDYVDTHTDSIKLGVESIVNERFNKLLSDAEAELADAKEEFADGEKKLADAIAELEDGRQKLEDGKNEIADAKIEVQKAKDELAEETLKAQNKLNDALIELANGEEEYSKGLSEFQDGEKQLLEGKATLSDNQNELDATKADLLNQLETAVNGEAELNAALAMIDENLQGLSFLGETNPMYQQQYPLLVENRKQYAEQLAQVQFGILQLEEGLKQIETGENELKAAFEEVAVKEAELEEARIILADARAELDNGYAEYEDGVQKLQEEIADAEQKIADAEQEIADGEEEIAENEQKILDGEKEVEDGRTELEEARGKIADAEKELAEIETPDYYALDRNTNVGYMCFDNDSSIVDEIADVFPIFFFAVAVLVCMTTMTRMIEDQRTQIGVLKALGYGEGSIIGKYLFYSGSAAVGGAVFGFALGTWLFPYVIWIAYRLLYGFAEIEYVFNPVLAAVSLVAAMACSMGATYFSCASQLHSVPASLIRPKAPKIGKRVFLEYVGFIWKHLSFLRKVSIRNVFRYGKRFIMMVLGISGCTALLVTALGLNDSIKNVVTDQYNQISTYDVAVNLTETVPDDERADFEAELASYLESQVFLSVVSRDIVAGDVIRSANVAVPESAAGLKDKFRLLDYRTEAELEYPGAGEAILSSKLASKLGVGIGDNIVVRDSDMREISVTVTALCKNYVYSYVFISKETFAEQMGQQPEYKTIYGDFKKGYDEHETAAKLSELEHVGNASLSVDFKDRFTKMMASLDYVIIMVIICAAALAFIVLYNLTNINITERIREIATIKVLGFYPGETAAYVFRENLILTAFGALSGLLLGKWLHMFVMSQIDIDVVSFGNIINPISYVSSIILTFVFAGLVNFVMYFKLERINMAESLKSIE